MSTSEAPTLEMRPAPPQVVYTTTYTPDAYARQFESPPRSVTIFFTVAILLFIVVMVILAHTSVLGS